MAITSQHTPRLRRLLLAAAGVWLLAGLCYPGFTSPVWASMDNGARSDHKARTRPYALLFGTVWAPDSRPAAGVRIKVRRADETKFRWERTSDSHGEFAVRLPAEEADYVVVAQPAGKRVPVETKVHINLDERTDIGLHLRE